MTRSRMSLERGLFLVKLVRGFDRVAMQGSDPRVLHASPVMINNAAKRAARGPLQPQSWCGLSCWPDSVSLPAQPLLLHS